MAEYAEYWRALSEAQLGGKSRAVLLPPLAETIAFSVSRIDLRWFELFPDTQQVDRKTRSRHPDGIP